MSPLQDRRVQAGVATLVVVLLAVLLAVFVMRGSRAGKSATGQAGGGALQVDAVQGEAKVSQTKPLRCFVAGQYIGDFPVSQCASKNGVAAQALDVGLDPATGQVAGGSATLQPLPAPSRAAAPAPMAPSAPVEAEARQSMPPAGPAECLRFAGGEWRGTGRGESLGQCVRDLFDGRCVRPGDALYGRYGALTVRLVPGRVELSPDNRTFRPLVGQDEDCNLPPG